MPKGFSERERALIRGTLLERGRAFFQTYGVRRTSVEDLTRAAGISKGAFYRFFDSKEELFMQVIEQFEREYREEVFGRGIDPARTPRDNVRELLGTALSAWTTHPLFRNFSREELEHLYRKLPPDRVRAHIDSDDRYAEELIASWQRSGVRVDADPQVLSGLIKALFFVQMHGDEIGHEVHPQIMRILVGLVADHVVGDGPAREEPT